MKKKQLSILIVNWNTKELLRQALDSVAPLKNTLSVEVLVIDNGSSDGSGQMVQEAFPWVRLTQNEQNLGFAKAVNFGLRQVQAPAVLLLNSDAQLLPGTVERLYEVLNSDPTIGMVGAELINEDGTLQNSIDHFPNFLTECLNKSLLKLLFPKWYPGKRTGFVKPTEVPSLIGAAIMVRTEAIEQVGLMDEDYFFFMEETDWCYRMQLQGWKRVFVPGARVRHLQGQTAKKFSWRSKIEFYRSRYHFFKKYRSRISCVVLSVGLLLKILLGTFATGVGILLSIGQSASLRDQFEEYTRLLVWHFRGCPEDMGISQQ